MSLLSQLLSKSRALFSPEIPERYTRKWAKFEEVVRLLSANLREIEDRWEGGRVQFIDKNNRDTDDLPCIRIHSKIIHCMICASRVP